MTVKRLNEIAKRVSEIRINYQINPGMDEVEKIKYADELLEFRDELLDLPNSYKYFWLKKSLLHELEILTSTLLK